MFIQWPGDIPNIPQRIVSTVPSITELLAYLGLDNETVGITKFCVHPEAWFRSKTRIGGTKNLNIEKIGDLNPDLIFCNKEENVKEQAEALAEKFPVCLTDVQNFEDALAMIELVGMLTGKKAEAEELIKDIRQNFSSIPGQPALSQNPKPETPNPKPQTLLPTAYLIWKDPYMTVGGDTFISDMMEKAGLDNIYKDQKRYPQLTIPELQTQNPKLLLLSSEPYPFKEKHIAELQAALPDTKILLADGEMFSWYGSRMLWAAEYFRDLSQQLLLNKMN